MIFSASVQQSQQDQEKMMQAFMKHMAVTENHAYFKNFVGAWEVTTTAWMQPGAEPAVSKGSAMAELILGGRFLKMEFKGVMFGQPFEGLQIVGYDNMKNKYITFWIDNSSTSFYLLEGIRDKSGKAVADTGIWPDPMTGGETKVRSVTRIVNPDEFIYEMYMITKRSLNITKRPLLLFLISHQRLNWKSCRKRLNTSQKNQKSNLSLFFQRFT